MNNGDCWGKVLDVAAKLCFLICVHCCFEVDGYDYIHKNSWSPSSPDLNLMDYLCGAKLNCICPTKASLIKSIKENMTSMDRGMFVKVCRAFRSWVQAAIDADGDYLYILNSSCFKFDIN